MADSDFLNPDLAIQAKSETTRKKNKNKLSSPQPFNVNLDGESRDIDSALRALNQQTQNKETPSKEPEETVEKNTSDEGFPEEESGEVQPETEEQEVAAEESAAPKQEEKTQSESQEDVEKTIRSIKRSFKSLMQAENPEETEEKKALEAAKKVQEAEVLKEDPKEEETAWPQIRKLTRRPQNEADVIVLSEGVKEIKLQIGEYEIKAKFEINKKS